MNLRILGYVGRKDYTLNGLLECYKFLPNNSEKILSYGMNLLTLCDYANEIGDNRVNVDDALFDVACELGFKYLDALFELKNTPDNLTYWRQEVLSVLYDKIDKLRGMEIVFATTAKTDEEGRALLKLLGMPFAS